MAKTSTNRRATQFHPRLEQLESVLLLSLARPVLVHAEARSPAVAPVDVHLAGTLHGTGKLSGSTVSASGSGNLGKVGTANFSVKVSLYQAPSRVTLSTKKGNITLSESGAVTPLASGYEAGYEVFGGTKSYAKATGSGTVTVTYSLLKGNKVALTLALD